MSKRRGILAAALLRRVLWLTCWIAAAGPVSAATHDLIPGTPRAAAATASSPEKTLAAEPAGYWTGPVNDPVPGTIRGGRVVHARRLAALLKRGDAVIVDVSNSPLRPDNLAPGAPWLPLPHSALPGAIWIPGAGLGSIPPLIDDYYRERLATATGRDFSRTLVIYCHRTCWLSWNGARRAISYGYSHVYWFPDGIEGWRAAGLPTAIIQPEPVPAPASAPSSQPVTSP